MRFYIIVLFYMVIASVSLNAAGNDVGTETFRDRDVNNFNDYEEVVMNHIKLNQQNNIAIANAKEDSLFFIPPPVSPSDNNNGMADSNGSNKDDNLNEIYYLSGYCFAGEKAVDVSRLSSYSYLRCNFDRVIAQNKTKIPDYLSSPTLATLLIPDAFSKALIGKPLYLSSGENRMSVLGGVIMNYEKTSINLAHIVNDRKIASFMMQGGIRTADVATAQAQAYLDAKRAAATEKNVAYENSANVDRTIVSENTAAPEVSDYLFNAGIKIVSELVKTGGEIFKEDLPYLFQTQGNAVYFVDIAVSREYQSLPSLNISGTSLAKDSTYSGAKNATDISLNEQQGTK